jgi:hypothetical protein
LLGRRIVRIDFEFDICIGKFRGGFFSALARYRPKVGGVVGNESQFVAFASGLVLTSTDCQ